MWKFSITTGQRTALFSCLDQGSDTTVVSLSHIYSSVGYCIVYFCLGFVRAFYLINEIQLHTFVILLKTHRSGVDTVMEFENKTSNLYYYETTIYGIRGRGNDFRGRVQRHGTGTRAAA